MRIEESTDVAIQFSEDGEFFAIYKKNLNILQIYGLKNIMDLMEKVENQDFLKELDQENTLKDAK